MNRLAYNVSLAVGLALIAAGTAWLYGPAVSLIVSGALVIALTFVGLIVISKFG